MNEPGSDLMVEVIFLQIRGQQGLELIEPAALMGGEEIVLTSKSRDDNIPEIQGYGEQQTDSIRAFDFEI